MAEAPYNALIKLDLNNPIFQKNLFALEKSERNSALETLKKLLQMDWPQIYRDQGLKWEKIISLTPPPGVPAIYSLRITQSCRATAYREDNYLRFLTITPNHDKTYSKK